VPGRRSRSIPTGRSRSCGGTTASEPCLFFVEADRARCRTCAFRSPDIEHLAGKYERYLAYARAKKSLEQFGVANFRVLTVTDGGETKLRNVAQAARDVCGGVGVGSLSW
jgi:hypothetical protein